MQPSRNGGTGNEAAQWPRRTDHQRRVVDRGSAALRNEPPGCDHDYWNRQARGPPAEREDRARLQTDDARGNESDSRPRQAGRWRWTLRDLQSFSALRQSGSTDGAWVPARRPERRGERDVEGD